MNKIIRFFNAGLLIISFALITNAGYVAVKSDTLPATPPITPPSITPVDPTSTPTPEPTTTPAIPGQTSGKATGGVKGNIGDVQFKLAFNAHGGEKVKGVVNYWNSTGTEFKGKVDVCYNQNGNKAVFAGTVYQGKTPGQQYFLVEVQDNGQGKKAAKDQAWARLSQERPTCEFVSETLGVVVNGNLRVHK